MQLSLSYNCCYNQQVVFSVLRKFHLLHTEKANLWRANTTNLFLATANLFLATTNLFLTSRQSRAHKSTYNVEKQCISSPQVSFYLVYCLINVIITLFFKLIHLPHIHIFKILSFLEREAYNPQAVKARCILNIKTLGR